MTGDVAGIFKSTKTDKNIFLSQTFKPSIAFGGKVQQQVFECFVPQIEYDGPCDRTTLLLRMFVMKFAKLSNLEIRSSVELFVL